ncbi:AAA family ATPase [Flammeovirgaceae bacterium SG7u.111]|nr:AAA family ATPase [Flammeovirgaceae bacterium SG7u.132]WPO37144.1 AAA family ATPase [Flammeovirgaceae bacterium SG7u.111]
MVKAFVFGKFLPFHKGHEAMVHFALQNCDFLSVLVCCSDKETIPDTKRKKWVEQSFEGQKNIEVRVFNYLESELPNTSESSKTVSKAWAGIFKQLFPDYSLLITSEEYGNYVASFMDIQHLAFDIPRQLYPVSATALRNDIFSYWKFLPASVKPDFAIKVVLLGTESTGKTTLSRKLSSHFNCSLVSEVAREIIENSNSFSFEDLHLLAMEHAKRIDQTVLGDSPLIIIDTDIHITKSYSEFFFDKALQVSSEIYNSNLADLYLYLNNDVPHVQDGTRLNETDRNLLDTSHRNTLAEHGIRFIEISGSWEERYAKAFFHIEKGISKRNKKSINYFKR